MRETQSLTTSHGAGQLQHSPTGAAHHGVHRGHGSLPSYARLNNRTSLLGRYVYTPNPRGVKAERLCFGCVSENDRGMSRAALPLLQVLPHHAHELLGIERLGDMPVHAGRGAALAVRCARETRRQCARDRLRAAALRSRRARRCARGVAGLQRRAATAGDTRQRPPTPSGTP